MSLKFLDGSTLTDTFRFNGTRLISKSDRKNRIYFKDLKEIVVYEGQKAKHFHIVKLKNKKHPGGIQIGFGTLVYTDAKIEVYHATFFRDPNRNKPIKYFNHKIETFARKKNEIFSQSIAVKDGYGWLNIMERLKSFFDDCPQLFDEMKRRNITERETLKILILYSDLCGKY